jgi:hypothetical protein
MDRIVSLVGEVDSGGDPYVVIEQSTGEPMRIPPGIARLMSAALDPTSQLRAALLRVAEEVETLARKAH